MSVRHFLSALCRNALKCFLSVLCGHFKVKLGQGFIVISAMQYRVSTVHSETEKMFIQAHGFIWINTNLHETTHEFAVIQFKLVIQIHTFYFSYNLLFVHLLHLLIFFLLWIL